MVSERNRSCEQYGVAFYRSLQPKVYLFLRSILTDEVVVVEVAMMRTHVGMGIPPYRIRFRLLSSSVKRGGAYNG